MAEQVSLKKMIRTLGFLIMATGKTTSFASQPKACWKQKAMKSTPATHHRAIIDGAFQSKVSPPKLMARSSEVVDPARSAKPRTSMLRARLRTSVCGLGSFDGTKKR